MSHRFKEKPLWWRRAPFQCANCGAAFYARGGSSVRFCSDNCRIEAHNKRRNERRREEIARTPRKVSKCLHCGKGLYGRERVSRRYCDDTCKMKAYRERQKSDA